jgi:hypothetical protein
MSRFGGGALATHPPNSSWQNQNFSSSTAPLLIYPSRDV